MPKTYLAVNSVSYRSVRHVADYIYRQIAASSQFETEFVLCGGLDEFVPEEGSVVFIIGESLYLAVKPPECTYVFLNFSVVRRVGGPLRCSLRGHRRTRRKRRMLERKLPFVDYLLEYWPAQQPLVERWAAVPVRGFPVAMSDLSLPDRPWTDRKYQVCIVGKETPRRARVTQQLRQRGVSLSPALGVDLEEIATESQIVLDVHAERCNHLALPRIIGAFASRSVLVTEHATGLDQYFPSDIYVCSRYSDVVGTVCDLLADPARMEQMAYRAWEWITSVYFPECDARWSEIVREVEETFA